MSTPRFLADEDLRFEIVSAVRRMEPTLEITTAVEAGLRGEQDDQVLAFADSAGLLLVSHDVNTMSAQAERRLAEGRGMAGLFFVPQMRPTRSVAESIILVWAASEERSGETGSCICRFEKH